MAHPLLRYAHNLLVVLAERDPLYCGRELPPVEALARLHGPQAHHVVGGAAHQEAGLCWKAQNIAVQVEDGKPWGSCSAVSDR